ncbi:calcium-activated chloride channel-domain-containing protein [Aspergillus cavernicola]|uniref:Calcium-activated chloride channel-domain-containing protein n=1 Tax=Aspergillus cavernicola TaxID=176166 RepID=A0ABR4IXU6_9EURO
MTSSPAPSGSHHNFYADYVIQYSYADADPSNASDELELLLRKLWEVGLQAEVRPGEDSNLLVFVRASRNKSLQRAIYQSRIRDWLHGVRSSEPEDESSAEPQTESERLRIINHMITLPRDLGGAGITPKHGHWKNVIAVFPLHDEEKNKEYLTDWSKKTFLSEEDLDQIRDKFGESVGFYFAFLQSYFRFLLFPAAFGFSSWLLLGSFSIIYTIVNCLWGIIFIEYWKRQEEDLSCRWQTKGVSIVRIKRREFKPEREVQDQITGETRGVFPTTTRLQRQLLQVPFALVSTVALGAIIATCFAIEIFISEVYTGPLKSYLCFIPTILLSALIPTMSGVLVSVATKLNDYENYETQTAYDTALTQKVFVINFITSYLPIFLTAFVYIPFASLIVPHLDVFHLTVRPFVSKEEATTHDNFSIDPDRLRKQVIYFTVTAQVVGFATETILPFVKQRFARQYKEYKKKKTGRTNTGLEDDSHNTPKSSYDDHEDEVQFLTRVRKEADRDDYNVTDDLREMCIQFGYLALFSPVWPLVPVSFLVNNWIELRSDFFKIIIECKRPSPIRADTIGPWLDTLGFLSWVGSITSAALVYMFNTSTDGGPNGEPSAIKGWALLLAIFFSEHLYLIVRYVVHTTMSKFMPHNVRREKTEQYMIRKRYLESTLGARSSDEEEEVTEKDQSMEISDITRKTLEDDARAWTKHDTDPEERFWMRQKGWRESAQVAHSIIKSQADEEGKKEQ